MHWNGRKQRAKHFNHGIDSRQSEQYFWINFSNKIQHTHSRPETQELNQARIRQNRTEKEEIKIKILIFEDLLAPSSKLEIWLPHDGRAKPQSRRNSRCKAMKHNFVRWKSTKQVAEDDYGVWNLTGEVTLGFTLGEGELR